MPVRITIFVLSLSYLGAPFICTNNDKANIRPMSAQTTHPVLGAIQVLHNAIFLEMWHPHTLLHVSYPFSLYSSQMTHSCLKHTADTHAAYWAVKKSQELFTEWERLGRMLALHPTGAHSREEGDHKGRWIQEGSRSHQSQVILIQSAPSLSASLSIATTASCQT